MKRISQLVSILVLICLLSGCGGSIEENTIRTDPPDPVAPAIESASNVPYGETAPAPASDTVLEAPAPEAPAVAMPPETPVPTETPAPTATPDPLEFVRFDWKPTREQAEELYNYALPFIQDQPYFVSAEFLYGNNYIVHVNCDPSEVDDSALPFMRAVRDKFYELRSDVHEIIYILFVNDSEEYSYPVSISVEDVE